MALKELLLFAIAATLTSYMTEPIVALWNFDFPSFIYGIEYPALHPFCVFSAPPEPNTWSWVLSRLSGTAYRCALSYGPFDYCVILIVLGGLSFLGFLLAKIARDSPIGARVRSEILNRLFEKTDTAPMRNAFDLTTSAQMFVPIHHTHPRSASSRNNASTVLNTIAKAMGRTPYFIQMSKSDERRGRTGCRSYHWAKDLTLEQIPFEPPMNAAFVYVDVDQYLDMDDILAEHPVPHLIYTFQPSSVAKTDGEYSFSFENDVVTYVVAGGAVYKHPVWNYKGDTVMCSKFVPTALSWKITCYLINRRGCGEHHQMIGLFPFAHYSGPFPVHFLLPPAPLVPLRVSYGKYNRMEAQTAGGLMRSVGLGGTTISSTVPASLDDALQVAATNGSSDISVAQVLQTAKVAGVSLDPVATNMLVNYHRSVPSGPCEKVFPVRPDVVSYQFYPNLGTLADKPCMKAFMKPLLHGATVPTKSLGNEKRSIEGRIEEIRPENKSLPDAFLLEAIEKFSQYLVPDCMVGTGTKVDIEEVYKRQNRPSQKRILDEACSDPRELSDDPVKSFMKAENYAEEPEAEPKDPRNISTVPPVNKLNYSQYVYSFVDNIIKLQPWYAFGKSPAAIAEIVARICVESVSHVNDGDLSRFDGRVTDNCRLVEQSVMLRYFGSDEYLVSLMSSQKYQKARTRLGVKYFTTSDRLSGSPETSSFNTLLNAFMVFLGFMKSGMSPPEAWEALGRLAILGGDDSHVGDIEERSYISAVSMMGHVLKSNQIPRGADGVNFLSRQFSDQVWFGNPDSCCDIPRQLMKYHLTVALPDNVTPLQKLKEKARSYSLTDAHTPIIGEFSLLAMEVCANVVQAKNLDLASWFSRFEETVQFPNENRNGWMDAYFDRVLPKFDRRKFDEWCYAVRAGRASILECPGFEPINLVPIVSSREVVYADTVVSPQDSQRKNPTPKGTPRPVPGKPQTSSRSKSSPPTPQVEDAARSKGPAAKPPLRRSTTRKRNYDHASKMGGSDPGPEVVHGECLLADCPLCSYVPVTCHRLDHCTLCQNHITAAVGNAKRPRDSGGWAPDQINPSINQPNNMNSRSRNTPSKPQRLSRPAPKRQRGPSGKNSKSVAVAYSNRTRNTAPKIQSIGSDVVISHQELCEAFVIDGIGEYQVHTVGNSKITPLSVSLFPWANFMARGYEFYEFESLQFIVRSNLASTTPGASYLAVDFDVLNPPPNSVQEIESLRGAVRANVWVPELVYSATREQLKRFGKVRSTSINFSLPSDAAVTDPRLNFLGNIWFATMGLFVPGTDVAPMLELYVRYRIRLSNPKPPIIDQNSFVCSINATQTAAGSVFDKPVATATFWNGALSGAQIGTTADEGDFALNISIPGYYELDVFTSSLDSEIESSEPSLFNIIADTPPSLDTKLEAFTGSDQVDSFPLSWFNASDTLTDDAPFAGSERWLIVVREVPYTVSFTALFNTSLNSPEITQSRLIVRPAVPAAYVFDGSVTNPGFPVLSPTLAGLSLTTSGSVSRSGGPVATRESFRKVTRHSATTPTRATLSRLLSKEASTSEAPTDGSSRKTKQKESASGTKIKTKQNKN